MSRRSSTDEAAIMNPMRIRPRLRLAILAAAMPAIIAGAHVAEAAVTDIADVPLSNATTELIRPNIAFVVDDSGSMEVEFMPDRVAGYVTLPCYDWHRFNTLAYNPAVTYLPPVRADGTRYPDMQFSAALQDGYFAAWQKQFDGRSDNGTVDLRSGNRTYYAMHKSKPAIAQCDGAHHFNTITSPAAIAAPGTANGSTAALTNYANWYSYYRRRAFLMKAAAGEAFAALDHDRFRVGLFFINSAESGTGGPNRDLAIDAFSGTHRGNWFGRLYGSRMGTFTPLRGALSRMGRMYAGRMSGWDPVQYSCQRNYAILSTDGYWNSDNEKGDYGPKALDGETEVGDSDGAPGTSRPSFDSAQARNTLADVAHYYYHTDLRPGDCGLCADNVPPSGTNAAEDDVAQHQHMSTFTIGLGVNGTLAYREGYRSSTSGDYFDIRQGVRNWPDPVDGSNDSAQRIDDLWHAAVNGRGTYFSAKDPASLVKGLSATLDAIESVLGSGAAAATSSLEPTPGDNAIYVATYRTVHWDGEVSAHTVDLQSGKVSAAPAWRAAPLLAARIGAAGDSDSRVIYAADGTARIPFRAGSGGLTATQLAWFDNARLSQHAGWDAGMRSAGTPAALVDYLRGQHQHEDQDGAARRLYRDREKILGDIVHSQPVYVRQPPHDFRDAGYAAFRSANASRAPTLYVAANDGMLHAFDAATGSERWAYVPPMVLPAMWRLADRNLASHHRYLLDGPLAVNDAFINGAWRTVLIGALGKGGRGYYALDVTDPSDPRPLWNFTASDNHRLGYTFGLPHITKLRSGAWVAVLSSGYNNVPEGDSYAGADGKGYLFALDLATGSLIRTIPTGAGSVTAPAGLSRINVEAADFESDNTAVKVYGGDLLGNMWRFDLEQGTATRLAAFGAGKPVTAGPEIADIDGRKVVFFGTGRYLGESDLSDSATQTIYAVKDDGSTLVSSASQLVRQTASTSGTARYISDNPVDWSGKSGWYLDLPDSGERIVIEPQLYFGTLVFASIVPTATQCQPGGYSWLYQLDYRTGGKVSPLKPAASRMTTSIVGLTVSKLPGKGVIHPVGSNGQIPAPVDLNIGGGGSGTGEPSKQIMWRVLAD